MQNPRAVGNEKIAFKPLLVGGGDAEGTYRADSFVCAAAQQAYVVVSSSVEWFLIDYYALPVV